MVFVNYGKLGIIINFLCLEIVEQMKNKLVECLPLEYIRIWRVKSNGIPFGRAPTM